MKLTSTRLLVVLCLGVLAGCISDPREDIAAFTKAPEVNTGDPLEHTGCEVKGSGATNPCLDTGKPVQASANPAPAAASNFHPSQCETGTANAFGGFFSHMGNLAAWEEYCEKLENQSTPSGQSAGATTTSGGGGMCANPFGGPAARSGQFICSNQGEIMPCQCTGSTCSLKHTGAMQCTKPGAVIN